MAHRKAGRVKSTALTGITFEVDQQGLPTLHGTRFQFTAQVLDAFGRERAMVSERMPHNGPEFGAAVRAWAALPMVEAGLLDVKFDAPPDDHGNEPLPEA